MVTTGNDVPQIAADAAVCARAIRALLSNLGRPLVFADKPWQAKSNLITTSGSGGVRPPWTISNAL
jgi:hypothetical protein